MAAVSLANSDHCWVTSLTTLLGPVAREEIRRELKGFEAFSACAMSRIVETFLRLNKADEVAFPAHYLLTTSLYAEGQLEALYDAPRPDRPVVLRSLNPHHHAAILARRGTLWPVRVVWIIDDIARDWRPRRDSRRDLQALEASALVRRRYATRMPEARLTRVLDLYRRLYIRRYSRHNPDYTADYLQHCLETGVLEILTLERDGDIVAFCAIHGRGGVLSAPMVGYDEAIDGLYRLIMALPALEAEARGLMLNLSAGAAHFKRHRGARPHVEYLMILDDHLPPGRRLPFGLVGALLQALEPKLIKAATQ